MPSRIRSSLWAKLLLAHLLVGLSGVATLILATAMIAPPLFNQVMQEVAGPGLRAIGHIMTPAADAAMRQLAAEVFRETVGTSLAFAVATAVTAAVAVSVFVSGRLASTIGRMTIAARRVASGKYSERVPVGEPDELGEMASSFNQMADALENDERRRVELVGNVAHELRTPLANLQGYLEGIVDGVVEPSRETWGFLLSETTRLSRLVADLQELSRAEARQISLHIHPVSPAELIEASAAGLRPLFEDKGISLGVSAPADIPRVLADRDRAVQVLTNFLSNALRYTPPGGSAEIWAAEDGASVRFGVRDTGMGIAPEDLPHVFERFYRVEKARSRAEGGSGIGLTIAKSLVEAMGGTIEAHSEGTGRGATFLVRLPAET